MIKFFLLLLVSLSVFAEYPAPTFNGPRDTMNYFLKTMKGHKTGDPKGLEYAIRALDTSHIDVTIRESSAKLAAENLIKTLDKIEYIDIKTVPESWDEQKWVYKKKFVSSGDLKLPLEISISKMKIDGQDKWKFSRETISNISIYLKSLNNKSNVEGVVALNTWRDKLLNNLPSWAKDKKIILQNWQWFALLILIIFAVFIERIVRRIVGTVTKKLLVRQNVYTFNKKREKSFTYPFGLITISGIWIFGVNLLAIEDNLLATFVRVGRILFTVGTVLTFHNFVDVLALYFEQMAVKSDNKFDDILVPLLRRAFKFFIISIGVIYIGESLTLDMKNILAGLGIGGLAFALAAKDTLSNIFGSITVLLDRPFRIGDWVLIGGNIEGTVVEVGLRSTRVRTFYDSLITVPNGQLTNIHIDNYGERTFRRYNTKIGIQYDTPPEKIEAFCEGIRQIIIKHPNTRKDYFHVYLNGLGASALEVMLYVFWKVPDWSQELAEKHRLLIDIIRLGHELGVEFAFPTQTLHVFDHQYQRPDGLAADEAHMHGMKKAHNIVGHPISFSESRSSATTGELPIKGLK